MSVIVCGQAEILGDECPYCGCWLHRVQHGGFLAAGGLRYCDEDCVTDQQEYVGRRAIDNHLNVRDLLCDCAEVCAPRGRPTPAEHAEWDAYVLSRREVSR